MAKTIIFGPFLLSLVLLALPVVAHGQTIEIMNCKPIANDLAKCPTVEGETITFTKAQAIALQTELQDALNEASGDLTILDSPIKLSQYSVVLPSRRAMRSQPKLPPRTATQNVRSRRPSEGRPTVSRDGYSSFEDMRRAKRAEREAKIANAETVSMRKPKSDADAVIIPIRPVASLDDARIAIDEVLRNDSQSWTRNEFYILNSVSDVQIVQSDGGRVQYTAIYSQFDPSKHSPDSEYLRRTIRVDFIAGQFNCLQLQGESDELTGCRRILRTASDRKTLSGFALLKGLATMQQSENSDGTDGEPQCEYNHYINGQMMPTYGPC